MKKERAMGSVTDVNRIEQRIVELAQRSPIFYYDIIRELRDEDYRAVMLAFGQIRQKGLFDRDPAGHFVLRQAGEKG
jgi:hypothetical protein